MTVKQSDFPDPHFNAPAGGRCWKNSTTKLWEYPYADTIRYEVEHTSPVTPEQALALARVLAPRCDPRAPDAAGIIQRQLEAHGVTITEDQARDVAAQVLQALPVLGEEE
jgi:hypothetical protein|tara:strand:+ start:778 stop:1107 length:330 start_codon:yes stop_codon:yes gene_type:complete